VRPDVEKTVARFGRVLEGADVRAADLAGLYLTGASSRIPLIPALLQQATGTQPRTSGGDPKAAVAHGAAAWAATGAADTHNAAATRQSQTNQPATGGGSGAHATGALIELLQNDARSPRAESLNLSPQPVVAFSPDGARLAMATGAQSVWLWDAGSGRQLARLQHVGYPMSVAFSSNGSRLATSGEEAAWVWDVASGRELARMPHNTGPGLRSPVALSSDGSRLAASGGSTAWVWDVRSGRVLLRVKCGLGRWVNSVALSPDGSRLATGCDADRFATVWDVGLGGQLIRLLAAEPSPHTGVYSVAFSPDGSRLATGGNDDFARVWDVRSRRELVRVRHAGYVYWVAFSPDGSRLATGSTDNSAKIWDIGSGRELASLVHDQAVCSVAFSPDGTRLATGSSDGAARMWGT
jgi:WD40 repeat protein